jgi:hypothetical protein
LKALIMKSRGETKAAFFRITPELDRGVKAVAFQRGEAAAVIVREILREGLQRRGVIEAAHPLGPGREI